MSTWTQPARKRTPKQLLIAALLEAIEDAGSEGITRGALRTLFPVVAQSSMRESLLYLVDAGAVTTHIRHRRDRKGVTQPQLTYFAPDISTESDEAAA